MSAGGLSVVVDDAPGRIKKLPSLYVNDVQIYADRDVDAVRSRLQDAVEAFVRAGSRSTYMLTPCEIGGSRGLYGADFFNRSRFRLELQRLGMTFGRESFTVLRPDDTFEAAAVAPFTAGFLVLPCSTGHRGVEVVRGARLVHQLAFYRISDLDAREVRRLARVCEHLRGIAASSAQELGNALRP